MARFQAGSGGSGGRPFFGGESCSRMYGCRIDVLSLQKGCWQLAAHKPCGCFDTLDIGSIEEDMDQTYIRDIAQHAGEEITIKGWLYNIRSSGKLMFPQIRDGSGVIQGVVFKKNAPEQVWKDFETLTQESSIIVKGTVRADERAPGGYELDVTGVEVLQVAEQYPITPKEHGVEFLMDHRHLWLKSRSQHAILMIRAEAIRADRD